jgi:hypothetical protein
LQERIPSPPRCFWIRIPSSLVMLPVHPPSRPPPALMATTSL